MVSVALNRTLSVALADDIDNRAVSWSLLRVGSLYEVCDLACFCEFEEFFLAFLCQDDFIVDIKAIFETTYFARIGHLHRFLLMEGVKQWSELWFFYLRLFFLKFGVMQKRSIVLLSRTDDLIRFNVGDCFWLLLDLLFDIAY